MRIAIGALLQESNTFAPARAGLHDFEKTYCVGGRALVDSLRSTRVELAGAIAALDRFGSEIVPLHAACGMAGGVVESATFATLRDRLLAPLKDAGRLDGVYLALHGAMMTEDSQDAESELLTAVRECVGDTPIAVSCDLHGNVTARMVGLADVIIGYQLYPHDDTYETGERAIGLLEATAVGRIRPVVAMRRAPMIIPGGRQMTAGPYPMADFHRTARGREADRDVLAASYFPTFSKFDGSDIGFRAVVVTDDDPATADRVALDMVREAWRRRHEFEVPLLPVPDAIRRGLAEPGGPVILVDAADCVGGGAAGDSVEVLRDLLALAPAESSVVLVNDAETAALAAAAGSGATVSVRLGNKVTPMYGPPVEAKARVGRVWDGSFTYSRGIARGVTASMGPSALLEIGEARVVCCSQASYEYGDDQFRAAGVDMDVCKFIVSKTVGNYVSAYPHARAAYPVDTPGPQTHNLRRLPWRNIVRPLYPWDDDFTPDFDHGAHTGGYRYERAAVPR